jgi:soluble lytic murein transglycosylase-like protein
LGIAPQNAILPRTFMARRRRRRSRLFPAGLSGRIVMILGICALIVLATNLAVRRLGGEVSLLSPAYLRERWTALGLFASHWAFENDHHLDAEIVLRETARRHGVSSRLVLAVAEVESALVHTRISATGAMGLMQLMPATARELGVRDPFDVRDNADGGVRYLKQLLASYRGNVQRAIAAYNAGPARVPAGGALVGLPGETLLYIERVRARL